jgi:hypothetical protein
MNRLPQLQATLPKNIDLLEGYNGQVELLLVNFIKDEEGLKIHDWILSLGKNKNLKYLVSYDLKYWHASTAKNTSHINATGSYLINLDSDNFINKKAIDLLLMLEKKNLSKTIYTGFTGQIIKKWRPWKKRNLRTRYKFVQDSSRIDRGNDGSYGNIGLSKALFKNLGGYNQALPPMGGQDADLIKRAIAISPNLRLLQIPIEIEALHNTKSEGLINTENPDANWNEYNKKTDSITQKNLINNILTANRNHPIGSETQDGYQLKL